MAERKRTKVTESIERQLTFETKSLLQYSRLELIDLAKNLANGKYKKDSHQRDKIMQLLVKQLSCPEASL